MVITMTKVSRHTFRYKLWLGLSHHAEVITFILLKFGPDIISFYLNKSDDGGNLEATLNFGLEYLGVILFMLPIVYITRALLAKTLQGMRRDKDSDDCRSNRSAFKPCAGLPTYLRKAGTSNHGRKQQAALSTCIARVIEMM